MTDKTEPRAHLGAGGLPEFLLWPRATALSLTFGLTVVALALYQLSPLLAPSVVVASSLIQIYWNRRDGTKAKSFLASPALRLVVPFGAWAAFSLLWTTNPGHSWSFIITYVVVVTAVLVGLQQFELTPADAVRNLVRGTVVAYSTTALIYLFEGFSGHALRRLVSTAVPFLRSTADGIQVVDGWVVAVAPFVTNKGIAVMSLLLWPVLLMSRRLTTADWQRCVRWGLLLVVVVAIMKSELETAKLAVPLGFCVFMLARWSPRVALGFAAIGWIVSCLLVVPIAHTAAAFQVHKMTSLPYSAQHRIIIWKRMADQVAEHPIIGRGIASTRYIDEQARASNAPADEARVLHSHNVFMQTWHELGLIGAICLLIAGIPMLRWIAGSPTDVQPYALATFATAGLISALSWSLIAPWYMATFGYVVLALAFGADVHRRASTPAVGT